MPYSRRHFIKTSSTFIAAAPAVVRGSNLNSKLQMAAIGTAGKGLSDTRLTADHDQVRHVAFCDVDLARTKEASALQPDAPIFQDFREMFAKLGDSIDAVTVSTPDHMHAYIALNAMRRGKHVFCQKPLTHNVWEARQMALQAKKSDVITRLGNQIHSHGYYRTCAAAIQSGIIGKVKRVHSWCAATGHGKSFHISRPKNPVEIPKTLDWISRSTGSRHASAPRTFRSPSRRRRSISSAPGSTGSCALARATAGWRFWARAWCIPRCCRRAGLIRLNGRALPLAWGSTGLRC